MSKTAATVDPPKVRHSPMEHPRHQFPQKTAALQALAQGSGLEEEIKWGKPCYTLGKRNVVLIQRFNGYIALLFFKGALLRDPDKLLSRVGEHMQAPRQLRFRSLAEITQLSQRITELLQQALELERLGVRVERSDAGDLALPEELRTRLAADATLSEVFHRLTPGRRKAYIFEIAGAKRATTRAARVDRFAPAILAGKGLHD